MTVKIGEAIREHRLRTGVTQEEPAEELGVSSQAAMGNGGLLPGYGNASASRALFRNYHRRALRISGRP